MRRQLIAAATLLVGATGLPAPAQAQNFGGFPVALTGPANITSNVLQLMNDQYGITSSAFTSSAYVINALTSWNVTFDFLLKMTTFDPQADGFAFVMQSNSPTTVGGGGGGVGYSGMPNSAGVTFQTWDNNTIGHGDNGSINPHATDFGISSDPGLTGSFDNACKLTSCYFAQLLTGHAFLSYDATTGSLRTGIANGSATFFAPQYDLTDPFNPIFIGMGNVVVPYSYDFTALFPQMSNVGNQGTYFGFTAGTGLSTNLVEVSNFTIDVDGQAPTVTPEPATFVLLGTGILGLFAVRRRKEGPIA
jgi:hypothetical protein